MVRLRRGGPLRLSETRWTDDYLVRTVKTPDGGTRRKCRQVDRLWSFGPVSQKSRFATDDPTFGSKKKL
ncbi:hypothetical protein SERLA73DRAFT_171606 [Serpula lacrymans var. lacrymans S7.3]|uniref:Uncharacterized protein n=1 Tax=Serpula lacrymans var. lacrymans (strain S7.3) TaxID=936435 RepID=F8QBY6_SERL3|nr:hypothetical protein SERLA73DRAFT_171606 [Serpula lacrymans var. lacrymans S7.3]